MVGDEPFIYKQHEIEDEMDCSQVMMNSNQIGLIEAFYEGADGGGSQSYFLLSFFNESYFFHDFRACSLCQIGLLHDCP